LTWISGGYTLASVIPKLFFILSTILASRVDVREYRIPDIYIVIPSIITIVLAAFSGLMGIVSLIAQGAIILVFFLLFRRLVKLILNTLIFQVIVLYGIRIKFPVSYRYDDEKRLIEAVATEPSLWDV